MNDRFKFRAKSINGGEWVYGAYYQHENDHYIITSRSELVEQDTNLWENSIVHIPVAPETVGQSTGLKDKNGKLIMESYICKKTYNQGGTRGWVIGKIVWAECGFYFQYGTSHNYYSEPLLAITLDEFEIIGNIYEHSHLLENR